MEFLNNKKIDLGLKYKELTTTKKEIRCYALSDLHADATQNQEWIKDNCLRKIEDFNYFTIFILPGDVASDIYIINNIFNFLSCNYDVVTFVPGNHELWKRSSVSAASSPSTSPQSKVINISGSPRNLPKVSPLSSPQKIKKQILPESPLSKTIKVTSKNSIEKLKEIIKIAKLNNVYVGPLRVKSTYGPAIVIFPLYSWYHSGFDKEPELTNKGYLELEEFIPFSSKWGDFSMCSWPLDLITQEEFTNIKVNNDVLATTFAELNEEFLSKQIINNFDSINVSSSVSPLLSYNKNNATNQVHDCSFIKEGDNVISFSHFLPRQQLCPEKRFLLEPELMKVIGSDILESQIRRLNPHLHLFGHTHIPIDLELEGIRYIQWPLGYHRESDKQCAEIFSKGPLLVFDSILGQGKEGIPSDISSANTHWASYYKIKKRDASEVEDLSWWLESKIEAYQGIIANNKKLENNI